MMNQGVITWLSRSS